MKIKVIWPGKTKEQFILEGVNKHLKLLRPYADISVIELKEEKGRDNIQKMIEKEGERILKIGAPYTLLDERGAALASGEFAEYISRHTPGQFRPGGRIWCI